MADGSCLHVPLMLGVVVCYGVVVVVVVGGSSPLRSAMLVTPKSSPSTAAIAATTAVMRRGQVSNMPATSLALRDFRCWRRSLFRLELASRVAAS